MGNWRANVIGHLYRISELNDKGGIYDSVNTDDKGKATLKLSEGLIEKYGFLGAIAYVSNPLMTREEADEICSQASSGEAQEAELAMLTLIHSLSARIEKIEGDKHRMEAELQRAVKHMSQTESSDLLTALLTLIVIAQGLFILLR